MKINSLKPILKVAIQNRLNILLKGKPGIGKSDVIEQTVKEIDWDLLICHAVVSDPTDFKGLPVSGNLNGKLVADFIPFGNLLQMIETEKNLVVLFDDLGQAPITVQAAIMQIILARQIDGKKISDKVSFVAATNSRADNAGVSGLITPLLSRFAGIFEIEVDEDSWLNWAVKNNMPAELMAFIKNKPSMLSTFTASKEIENFACPRTIANLGRWINNDVIDFEVWKGAVGAMFATEFMAFYQLLKKVGNLPADIMVNPTKARTDLTPDLLYFVIIALNNRATDAVKFETVMQYIERIPVEFQVFALKLITTKNPRFMETASYVAWSVKNASVIQ